MYYKIGSTGPIVKDFQMKLNNLGFNVGLADGIYGQGTYSGVVAFQNKFGLTSDGIVGDETLNTINAQVALNSKTQRSVSNTANTYSYEDSMLTTYINTLKANKLYMGLAIAGLAGISFVVYKKVKK